MKKLVSIIVACLLSCATAVAQDNKITVVDFYLNEKDLTANMHGSIEYDQNGEIWANRANTPISNEVRPSCTLQLKRQLQARIQLEPSIP